ncbi:MAG TPA: tetratricopeptide repeat protein [Myxococcota bacterium]|nr:tetratricopeptide repeat protein [Myxococcota bacterium]
MAKAPKPAKAPKKVSPAKLVADATKAFHDARYADAAGLFHAAFEATKEPTYTYSEASCWVRLHEPLRAVDLYEAYLVLVPEGERPEERVKAVAHVADLRIELGRAFKDAGECADALRELDRALEKAPERGEPWVHIGDCHEKLGDSERAIDAYERALAATDLDSTLASLAETRLAALKTAAAMPALPSESGPASASVAAALPTPASLPALPAAAPAPTPALPPPSPAPPAEAARHPRWGLWAAFGGGALAAGVVALVAGIASARPHVHSSGSDLGLYPWAGW